MTVVVGEEVETGIGQLEGTGGECRRLGAGQDPLGAELVVEGRVAARGDPGCRHCLDAVSMHRHLVVVEAAFGNEPDRVVTVRVAEREPRLDRASGRGVAQVDRDRPCGVEGLDVGTTVPVVVPGRQSHDPRGIDWDRLGAAPHSAAVSEHLDSAGLVEREDLGKVPPVPIGDAERDRCARR